MVYTASSSAYNRCCAEQVAGLDYQKFRCNDEKTAHFSRRKENTFDYFTPSEGGSASGGIFLVIRQKNDIVCLGQIVRTLRCAACKEWEVLPLIHILGRATRLALGEVREWLKRAVSKTAMPQGIGSSNLPLSAENTFYRATRAPKKTLRSILMEWE